MQWNCVKGLMLEMDHTLKRVAWRFYQDFFMGSRLAEYERLLQQLRAEGYEFLRMVDLATCARSGGLPDLACVIRVDVDSDLATAQRMFAIEQNVGIRSTYYFRKCTLNARFMQHISAQGSEVGFHFEELATRAKRSGLRTKAQVDGALPEIRKDFAGNLEEFAARSGSLPRTIASHGDFINRKLGIPNHYAISAAEREQFGLVAEAYDEWLNAPIKARFRDCGPPDWWFPCSPQEAIAARVSCLFLLVHPRQWRANVTENLRLEIGRVIQHAAWKAAGVLNSCRAGPAPAAVAEGTGSIPPLIRLESTRQEL